MLSAPSAEDVPTRPILDGVDLTVDEGEIVGLVGESGSGQVA